MLKFLQERVNRSTKEFDQKVAEQRSASDADAISKKQGRVHDLTRRLAEKLGKENETEGGR